MYILYILVREADQHTENAENVNDVCRAGRCRAPRAGVVWLRSAVALAVPAVAGAARLTSRR